MGCNPFKVCCGRSHADTKKNPPVTPGGQTQAQAQAQPKSQAQPKPQGSKTRPTKAGEKRPSFQPSGPSNTRVVTREAAQGWHGNFKSDMGWHALLRALDDSSSDAEVEEVVRYLPDDHFAWLFGAVNRLTREIIPLLDRIMDPRIKSAVRHIGCRPQAQNQT